MNKVNEDLKYYKILVTNHIIEIYEIDKQPYIPDDTDRKDESYDMRLLSRSQSIREEAEKNMRDELLDEQFRKIDRKKERRAQTLRDARNNCRRLAIANFDTDSYFFTLTFKENINDIDYADNELKKFFKKLKYRYGDYTYLAVREFQKRGAIHYHILMNIDIGLDIPEWYRPKRKGKWLDEKSKKFNHEFIMPKELEIGAIWKHGYVDIEACKHIDNIGAYLTKYMSKEFDDSRLKGKKAYLPSRGLEKPKIYKGTTLNEDIKSLLNIFKQKKETYTNQYDCEYLGRIIYKEFNLKRV